MGGGSMDGEDLWMGRGGKYMSKEKGGRTTHISGQIFLTLSLLYFFQTKHQSIRVLKIKQKLYFGCFHLKHKNNKYMKMSQVGGTQDAMRSSF